MATQLKKTVMPSGGDYTSLEACMNANEQNLVTADQYFDVEIDGTWSSADTSAVTIHNYTTDATRYINIYTTSASRHLGVYSTSYYQLAPATGNCMTASSRYVRVTGLQITCTTNGDWQAGIWIVETTVNKCIIRKGGTGNNSYIGGINFDGNAIGTCLIYNNIIYGFTGNTNTGGINCFYAKQNQSPTILIYNNTIYGCTQGILGSSYNSPTATWTNNLCNGNTTDYNLGSTSVTATDNISEDTTSPNNEWDSKAVAFVDEANKNFHLDPDDTSGAIDGGTDLSATFTDDIDGVTRSGTWDIGADEYVVPEPPAGGGGNRFMTTWKGWW